jgi:predicted glycosyltransferase
LLFGGHLCKSKRPKRAIQLTTGGGEMGKQLFEKFIVVYLP